MSNPWFRMYSEFSHDPKVQMLSEAMQRRYIMVMCLRCSNGLVTLHETEIAFHLRITDAELAETKTLFITKGFIDNDWNLLNWDKRQFVSDTSAERVKRHRAKRVEQGLPQQNSISTQVRLSVFDRDNCSCIYCGSQDDLTIDHKTPQSRGGGDEVANLATACRACNASKRDLTHDEFRSRATGNVTVTPQIQNRIDTDKKKEDKKPRAEALDCPFDVDEQVWNDFLKIRKAKRSPLTNTALTGIRREADIAGVTLESALKVCCERGWQGFKAEYLADKSASTETVYQKSMRLRVAEIAPELARAAPGAPNITDYFRTIDVSTTKTLEIAQ